MCISLIVLGTVICAMGWSRTSFTFWFSPHLMLACLSTSPVEEVTRERWEKGEEVTFREMLDRVGPSFSQFYFDVYVSLPVV